MELKPVFSPVCKENTRIFTCLEYNVRLLTRLECAVVTQEGQEGPCSRQVIFELLTVVRRETARGVEVHAPHAALEGPGEVQGTADVLGTGHLLGTG